MKTEDKVIDTSRCCFCGCKLDLKPGIIPAQWFGRYTASTLEAAICVTCIQDPETKKRWSAGDIPDKPES